MAAPARFFKSTFSLLEAAKATTLTPKPVKKPKVVRSKPNGILKLVPVSSALSNFIGGAPETSRTQAVKKVWEHIKLHNLQNPENKREIICDDKLKTIFDGKDRVGFLEIAKLLGAHFVKVN